MIILCKMNLSYWKKSAECICDTYCSIILKKKKKQWGQMSQEETPFFLNTLLLIRLHWYCHYLSLHFLHAFYSHRFLCLYRILIYGIIIQLWRCKNISVIHRERMYLYYLLFLSKHKNILLKKKSFHWNNASFGIAFMFLMNVTRKMIVTNIL